MAICSRLAKRTWKIYEVVHAEILKSEQTEFLAYRFSWIDSWFKFVLERYRASSG